MLNEEVLQYIEKHWEEGYELLLTLAQIPAPSHHEEKRVEFCKNWLEEMGAKGVYVDEAECGISLSGRGGQTTGGIYGPHGCGISGYHTSPIKRGGRKDLLSRRW